MTTSGSYNFSVSRNDIITAALQDLQVIGEGDSPSSYDLQRCTFALNLILKKWAVKTLPLWAVQTINFNFINNVAVYTMGPGGNVPLGFRPLRITEGWTRDINGTDSPLYGMARVDYDLLGNKGSTAGTPVNYMFMPTISNSVSTATSTISFYPTPSDSTRKCYLNVHRPLQDVLAGTDEFDFPQEWFHAIKWNLCAEVAMSYRISENIIMYIRAMAKESLEECIAFNQEEASVTFSPDMSQTGGGYGRG
jgi:hypothetical protein